jgi:hypothetical protein
MNNPYQFDININNIHIKSMETDISLDNNINNINNINKIKMKYVFSVFQPIKKKKLKSEIPISKKRKFSEI